MSIRESRPSFLNKITVLRYKKHFYLTQREVSLKFKKKSPLKIVLAKTGSLTTLNKRITIQNENNEQITET